MGQITNPIPYEEGTFTPALLFGGSATGITYGTQIGAYTRIGRKVFVEIDISLTSKGAQTGNATISGLPFTAGTAANNSEASALYVNMNLTGMIVGQVPASGNTITLFNISGATFAAGAASAATNANFADTTVLRLSLNYTL